MRPYRLAYAPYPPAWRLLLSDAGQALRWGIPLLAVALWIA